MTLKEIARQANVSVSTVSRVINQKNTKAASPEVQERIWEIVRKSGYTPNATARSLKLGQKAQIQNTTPKSIACIYARSNSAVSDPFFSQLNRRPSKATILSVSHLQPWILQIPIWHDNLPNFL